MSPRKRFMSIRKFLESSTKRSATMVEDLFAGNFPVLADSNSQ
jgi:hypothetical protein